MDGTSTGAPTSPLSEELSRREVVLDEERGIDPAEISRQVDEHVAERHGRS